MYVFSGHSVPEAKFARIKGHNEILDLYSVCQQKYPIKLYLKAAFQYCTATHMPGELAGVIPDARRVSAILQIHEISNLMNSFLKMILGKQFLCI